MQKTKRSLKSKESQLWTMLKKLKRKVRLLMYSKSSIRRSMRAGNRTCARHPPHHNFSNSRTKAIIVNNSRLLLKGRFQALRRLLLKIKSRLVGETGTGIRLASLRSNLPYSRPPNRKLNTQLS